MVPEIPCDRKIKGDDPKDDAPCTHFHINRDHPFAESLLKKFDQSNKKPAKGGGYPSIEHGVKEIHHTFRFIGGKIPGGPNAELGDEDKNHIACAARYKCGDQGLVILYHIFVMKDL